jgi:hypothetical protein
MSAAKAASAATDILANARGGKSATLRVAAADVDSHARETGREARFRVLIGHLAP